MKKLLTIIIPTYNRVSYLEKLIPELWIGMAENRDDIQLIVSDNASPDGTAERLSRFSEEGIDLTIVCKHENVGPDRNFIEALPMVSGRYCWLLGDDDLPLPGAIPEIVKALKTNEPALLYLKSAWFNDAFGSDVVI